MIFNAPVNFTEAAKLQAAKAVLPTSLNSMQLQSLGADFFRRAQVIARVEDARVVDGAHKTIQAILDGKQNLTYGRLAIQQLLDDVGGVASRPDLASQKSVDRMLMTNLDQVRGYAATIAGNEPEMLTDFPALELVRFEDRVVPRGDPSYKPGTAASVGWEERWVRAAQIAGDDDALRILREHDRMVARVDSDIWDTLGDSGVFEDGLDGNPRGPFAWGSGMFAEPVERADAMELGLIEEGEQVEPAEVTDINENFEITPSIANEQLLGALVESLKDLVTIKDGVLTFK